MSDSTAVVDGATALSSIVPAEVSPLSLTNHIWYTVPGLGFGTLFITSTPAFLSREKTTVAVPPAGNVAGDGVHVRCGEHLLRGRGLRWLGPQRHPDPDCAQTDHRRGRRGQQRRATPPAGFRAGGGKRADVVPGHL